ncbi:MAG: prepilin-type N-terminal cleavage/methylation domain-containing protein [Candidatus Omnitrophota bacterium]
MRRIASRAFTLIEVIIIVLIIGIIAVIAIPKMINYRDAAQKAAEEATISAVQTAVGISSAVEEME